MPVELQGCRILTVTAAGGVAIEHRGRRYWVPQTSLTDESEVSIEGDWGTAVFHDWIVPLKPEMFAPSSRRVSAAGRPVADVYRKKHAVPEFTRMLRRDRTKIGKGLKQLQAYAGKSSGPPDTRATGEYQWWLRWRGKWYRYTGDMRMMQSAQCWEDLEAHTRIHAEGA